MSMAAAIDWSRMAEPQADGYDTLAILRLIEEEPAPWRPHPPIREAGEDAPSVCDGTVAVAIRDAPLLPAPRFAPVHAVHPNFTKALNYVARWPVASAQFPRIIHTVQCFTDTAIASTKGEHRLGSASHSINERFGVIGLTVDSPLATAQAVVHEMAHHKLRAIGIANEEAIRIVTNSPADLFPSPVVVEQPRPMTAVLHAEYSFIHVTQLDLMMHAGEENEKSRADILVLLARNVPRMEAGFATIRQHVQTDAAGKVFIDAFLNWSDQVLRNGRRVLETAGL
jgi:HEXXH motif-containing protein